MNKRNLLLIKKRPVIFSFCSLFILYVCGLPQEYERGAEAAAALHTTYNHITGARMKRAGEGAYTGVRQEKKKQ